MPLMGEYKKYTRHNVTFYINAENLYFATKFQTMLVRPKGQASTDRIDVLAHLIRYNSIKDMSTLITYIDRNKLTYLCVERKQWM